MWLCWEQLLKFGNISSDKIRFDLRDCSKHHLTSLSCSESYQLAHCCLFSALKLVSSSEKWKRPVFLLRCLMFSPGKCCNGLADVTCADFIRGHSMWLGGINEVIVSSATAQSHRILHRKVPNPLSMKKLRARENTGLAQGHLDQILVMATDTSSGLHNGFWCLRKREMTTWKRKNLSPGTLVSDSNLDKQQGKEMEPEDRKAGAEEDLSPSGRCSAPTFFTCSSTASALSLMPWGCLVNM